MSSKLKLNYFSGPVSFTLRKFISIRYTCTFLVDCGHFELSGANEIFKQCHIARSGKSLRAITLFKETRGIAKVSLCFAFSFVEMPTAISDIRLAVLVNRKIHTDIYIYIFIYIYVCTFF